MHSSSIDDSISVIVKTPVPQNLSHYHNFMNSSSFWRTGIKFNPQFLLWSLSVCYRCLDLTSRFPFAEMRQPPYWSGYSKPRLFVHTIISSKYFDLAIAGVIGLNVITMALEYYMMPQVSHCSMKPHEYLKTSMPLASIGPSNAFFSSLFWWFVRMWFLPNSI